MSGSVADAAMQWKGQPLTGPGGFCTVGNNVDKFIRDQFAGDGEKKGANSSISGSFYSLASHLAEEKDTTKVDPELRQKGQAFVETVGDLKMLGINDGKHEGDIAASILRGCLRPDGGRALGSVGAEASDVCETALDLYQRNDTNMICAFAPGAFESIAKNDTSYSTMVTNSAMYAGDYSTDGTQNE